MRATQPATTSPAPVSAVSSRCPSCGLFISDAVAVLPTSRLAVFARAVLLPLLLALAVVLGLGSYCETSDDGTLAWLLAGVLTLKPVVSVPLYLHGYGHLLAAAYVAAPTVPWLGLLLAGLLAAASALWFAVLERLLRPWLRPGGLTLALTLFFGLAWLEHWLWFSHARVALLLAAGGLLFAAQRVDRRGALLLGLAALLAAWLVRPGLATLAGAAVLPAALLLAGGPRRAAPLLLSAALLLALCLGLATGTQTPAEARVQARDTRLARILDYEQLRPTPRTTADSLGTAAIGLWLLGDSTVVDPVLRGPVYRFDGRDFFGRVLPAKLQLRAQQLVRDYFPMLLALLATAVVMLRTRPMPRGFWLVQLAFAAGLLILAGFLKLPPRLALPLLDCWLLTNLIYWLNTAGNQLSEPVGVGELERGAAATISIASARSTDFEAGAGRSFRRLLVIGILLLVSGLYAAKTWHRHLVLRQEQRRHERPISFLRHRGGRPVRILDGTNDLLKSLSPFRTYSPGPGPVLLLTGWPAHDASQASLRRALSGTTDQTECLRRLASLATYSAPPRAVWLLTAETAHWLSRRLRAQGPRLLLYPEHAPVAIGADSAVHVYHVQGWPEH